MPKFTFVVLSNAVPGREQEFNDWYTNQHLPDLLRVPGVQSAQRFRRTAQQRSAGPQPWEYMALYHCDAPEPDALTRELKARAGSAQLLMSDAIAEVRYGCYFEPITELMVGAGAT
jgi:hypothetical protein